MTIDFIALLRRKPWRRSDHRAVFAAFGAKLGHLVAPGQPAPPRIHMLP